MFLKKDTPYDKLIVRCIFYVDDSYSRPSFRRKS